ncbi:MAG: hypothetical protein AB4060_23145 [Crocosphaera sp.]
MPMKNLKYGLKTLLTVVFLISPQIALANPLDIPNSFQQSESLTTNCKLSEKKEPIELAQRSSDIGCWKLI